MPRSTLLRSYPLLSLFLLSAVIGCGGGDGKDDPTPEMDGGVVGACDPVDKPAPTVTTCEGFDASAAGDSCAFTDGGSTTLLSGVVLTPGEVLEGGQVLFDAAGEILCVGCDCAGMAVDAKRIDCGTAVVSPGLINTHDHMTYQGAPFTLDGNYSSYEGEKFEHRNDWRRGLRGHTEVPNGGTAGNVDRVRGELRMAMGGATSTNASGFANGLIRNLDKSAQEGLNQPEVNYETFPLGDTGGIQLAGSCAYPGFAVTASQLSNIDAYTPHVAEGIDPEANNEFLCLREGTYDNIAANTSIIHGIGLHANDVAEVAAERTKLIWSPRSNISLYGETAAVTLYDRMGVTIALGTDWLRSGSMNVLRELQCADLLNQDYYGNHFTDEELWLMATTNAAKALAVDDAVGTLAQGLVADIAVFARRGQSAHRAVITADTQDVLMVLRGGTPLLASAEITAGLSGDTCATVDVCGTARSVCLGGTGITYADIEATQGTAYPLFFCDGDPNGEPTCVPSRDADAPLPSPEVRGSNRYTGDITADDVDGDGIPNAMDNCECTFNPIRPMDYGEQADFDQDGLGDVCDPCPLDADNTACSTYNNDDRDNDGTANAADNCPNRANPDQADMDNDGIGDQCDACPAASNPNGAPCPASVYAVKRGEVSGDVAIDDVVVTAVGPFGLFVQVPEDATSYEGADYSGIFIYTGGAPTQAVGDRVALTRATVGAFNGQTQLQNVAFSALASGATLPTPVSATVDEVRTGGGRAEALESVLTTLNDVTVTAVFDGGGFAVDGQLAVGTIAGSYTRPTSGEVLDSLTGVVAVRFNESTIQPRSDADIDLGAPEIAGFSADESYVRVGATGAIPAPLTVQLTHAATQEVTVTMGTDGAVTPTDVVVPVGMASGEVTLNAAAPTPAFVTLTATLGGSSATTLVRAIAVDAPVALAALTPAASAALVNETVSVTVTLDLPAPTGGALVSLASTAGIVPASVTVPADALTATFDFTAPGNATTATITASYGGGDVAADVAVSESALGALVINEVDYDQPGTDSGEFIELYNRTGASISLDGIKLMLINGNGNAVYLTVDLTGTLDAGGYLVVGAPGVTVPGGVTKVVEDDSNGGFIQNGPDGIALIDATNDLLLDGLAYESDLMNVTLPGLSAPVDMLTDAGSDTGSDSLSRSPNGVGDFAVSATPTPGAANM